MPDFCTCGAQLPPDARFCHKCGKPQRELLPVEVEVPAEPLPVVAAVPAPPPEISFGNGTAVRIGFLAALFAVLLIILFPIPPLMLSFIAAGFLAVYLYRRRTGQRLTLRAGARLGWITGIFSFTIVMIQFTASVLAFSGKGGFIDVFKQQLPPNDAGTSLVLQMLEDPAGRAAFVVMMLLFMFILLTILPTLGGLLGAKLLAREH